MKFNPISVTPEQTRSTTPDTFLTDQYGKTPAVNGDGTLTIHQATRLSKIICGYTPAFCGGLPTKIITGFYFGRDCLELLPNGDLKIKLPPGKGIINNLVFRFPTPTEYLWKDFLGSIPTTLPRGTLIIYFRYRDKTKTNPLRPLPQDYPHLPTQKLPLDQSEYNPIEVVLAFYDPETLKLVEADWSDADTHVLVAANIKFDFTQGVSRSTTNKPNVWVDENDRAPIWIGGKKYHQQGGGYSDVKTIDGGWVGTKTEDSTPEVEVLPSGIHLLQSGVIRNTSSPIPLGVRPYSPNDVLVFFNGMMYYPGSDWSYLEADNTIRINQSLLTSDRSVYIFENIKPSEFGSIQKIYSGVAQEKQNSTEIPGLSSDRSYLVFKNGLLEADPPISKDRLRLPTNPGDWLVVLEVFAATSSTSRFVELTYNGPAPGGSIFKSARLRSDRKYLVFYNGLLYQQKLDYRLKPNTIIMGFPMNQTKNLTVVGI